MSAIDSDNLIGLTIAELGDRIRWRKVSPVEIVDACPDRIERLDSRLHDFLDVTPDQARSAAREAEIRIGNGHYRGDMDGIPFGRGALVREIV